MNNRSIPDDRFTAGPIGARGVCIEKPGCECWECRQIEEAIITMAPSTLVSELRQNGIPVLCSYVGRSGEGKKVFKFSLY